MDKCDEVNRIRSEGHPAAAAFRFLTKPSLVFSTRVCNQAVRGDSRGVQTIAQETINHQTNGDQPMNTLTSSKDNSMSRTARPQRTVKYEAWVAKAAKQPLVLEAVDMGPLGAEDVEVAVEHCGLCHSDLSVLNNDWGISQYPAILGHEVTGLVTATGPNAKGLLQRFGWPYRCHRSGPRCADGLRCG